VRKTDAFCKAYGTRAQGICPFEIEGGLCRKCPESVAAFGVIESIPGKDSCCSNSTNSVASKKKSARFFLTNIFKKWTQLVFSRFDSRWHKKTPCNKCIKRGGICQPYCKKRRGA